MIAILAASDRKAEARSRQWEDAERFKACVGFAGKAAEWDEWSDRLLGTVKSRSVEVYSMMRLVEHKITEKTLEGDDYAVMLAALDDGTLGPEDTEQMSAKLHLLLGNVTTGDAHAVVRRSLNGNGFLAWKRQTSTWNPKTLASGLKCINAAHNPPRIVDVRQIDVCVEEWQSKLEKLAAEYRETISSKVKLAIFHGMLPQEIQEKLLDKCRIQ